MPTKKQPESTPETETQVEATPAPKQEEIAKAVVSRIGEYTEPQPQIVETKTRNGNTITTSKG
tara:strand:+ start:170 stop:358 length:189 start_codon:yes stop_codon:yes gene_type:complete